MTPTSKQTSGKCFFKLQQFLYPVIKEIGHEVCNQPF